MKSIFVRVLLAFLLLIGVALVVGSLLPRGYDLNSEMVINAPPEKIFPHLNSLKKWNRWSPWNPGDLPEIDVEYGQTVEGVDANLRWSDARGKGKVWITESVQNEAIEYKLLFGPYPEMASRISLTPVDEGKTKIEWTSVGELPSGPFYGIAGGMMFKGGMESEYKKALGKLKAIAEK